MHRLSKIDRSHHLNEVLNEIRCLVCEFLVASLGQENLVKLSVAAELPTSREFWVPNKSH